MKFRFCAFAVVLLGCLVLGACTAEQSQTDPKRPFKGDLHDATVAEWAAASPESRLSTASDWIVQRHWQGRFSSVDDGARIQSEAARLVAVLDEVPTALGTDPNGKMLVYLDFFLPISERLPLRQSDLCQGFLAVTDEYDSGLMRFDGGNRLEPEHRIVRESTYVVAGASKCSISWIVDDPDDKTFTCVFDADYETMVRMSGKCAAADPERYMDDKGEVLDSYTQFRINTADAETGKPYWVTLSIYDSDDNETRIEIRRPVELERISRGGHEPWTP